MARVDKTTDTISALELSAEDDGTQTTHASFGDGVSASLSAAGKGSLRYNDTTKKFEISVDGAGFTDISAAVPTIPTNRTIWVDTVSGNDGTGTPGNMAFPYRTITAALVAAVALTPTAASPVNITAWPGTYTEPPLTIPSYVTLQGTGDASDTIITASTATSPLISGSSRSTVQKVLLTGANGVGGVGYQMAVPGVSYFHLCRVEDCTVAVQSSGAGSAIEMIEVNVERKTGQAMTTGFECVSGGIMIGSLVTAFGESGVPTTYGARADGAGSAMYLHTYHIHRSVNGASVSNGGDYRGWAGSHSLCTNASRIEATDGTMLLNGVQSEAATSWDVFIEGGAASIFTTTGCNIDGSKISRTSTSMWVGDWINNFAGDEGVNIEGELHVGSYIQPSESTFGGGDSHVLGLAALTNTNLEAGAWNDISVEIASVSGSTVDVFAGVAAANCFYIGGDTTFPGLKQGVTVPLTLGAGTIVFEYWNGAAWVAFQWMAALSGAPYTAYGNAIMPAAASYQVRFGNMPSWATKSLNGTTKYWVRYRITVGITTSPTVEQMKLHTDRTEINSDGFVEYFGNARSVRTIMINTNWFQAAGGSPGNQDVAYGTNLIVGMSENSFADNQTQQVGIVMPMPVDFDTSMPLNLDIEWMPNNTNAGNVEWRVFYVPYAPDSVVTVATPGPLTEKTAHQVSAAPGVQYQGVVSSHELNIPEALAVAGWSIALMIQRVAGAGNPTDTYAGNAIVRAIRLDGVVWRVGHYNG